MKQLCRKLPLLGNPSQTLPPHPLPKNTSLFVGLYNTHTHMCTHTHTCAQTHKIHSRALHVNTREQTQHARPTSFLLKSLRQITLGIDSATNLRLHMTPSSSCSSTQVQKAWLIEVNPTHGATHISDGLLIGVSDQYSPGNMIMLVPHLRNSVLLTIFPVTHALSHTAVTGSNLNIYI